MIPRSLSLLWMFLLCTLITSAQAQSCDESEKFYKDLSKSLFEVNLKMELGRYQSAIEAARRTQALCSAHNYLDGVLGSNSLMVRGFVQMMNYDSAMWYAHWGLDFAARHADILGLFEKIIADFTYGVVLEETGRYREALAVLEPLPDRLQSPDLTKNNYWDVRCLGHLLEPYQKQMEKQYLPFALGSIYTYMGDAHNYLWNVEAGITCNLRAAYYYQQANNMVEEANAWLNAGTSVLTASRQRITGDLNSEIYFDKARQLLRNIPGSAAQLSMIHYFLGSNRLRQGITDLTAQQHLDSALWYAQRADSVKLFHAARMTKTQLSTLILSDKAALLSLTKQTQESRQIVNSLVATMEQALQGTPKLMDLSLWSSIYGILCITSIRNDDPAQANTCFEQAWRLSHPNTSVEVMLDQIEYKAQMMPDNPLTLWLLYLRGKILEMEYLLEPNQRTPLLAQALLFYESAIIRQHHELNKFAMSERGSVWDEINIANLNATYNSLYQDAMMATYILHQKTQDANYIKKMYWITEHNKNHLLRSQLLTLRQSRDVSDDTLAKAAILRDSLLYLRKQIELAIHTGTTDVIENYAQQLTKIKNQIQVHIESVQKNFPSYYNLVYSDNISDLNTVQATLNDDTTAVLAYFYYSDTIIFLTLLHAQKEPIIQLIKTSVSLSSNINDMMQVVADSKFNIDKNRVQAYLTSAAALYDALIQPVASQLQATQRLIVIPDGPLRQLNFELLLTQPHVVPKEKGFEQSQEFPYLLRKYAISYAPSLSFLVEVNDLQKNSKGAQHLRYGGFEPDYSQSSFPSFNEVSAIKVKYFPQQAEAWRGRQVTKATFKEVMKKYSFDILHFSGHSQLDAIRPLDNRMLFVQDTPTYLDTLTLAELYTMRIRAKLAILGSCDSGNSRFVQPGEGVLGLSRGFAYAGCPGMIVGQWKVENTASEEIMNYFFKYLNEGYLIDRALRQAKLDYLDHPDRSRRELPPNLWAPYIAWGYMQSIAP